MQDEKNDFDGFEPLPVESDDEILAPLPEIKPDEEEAISLIEPKEEEAVSLVEPEEAISLVETDGSGIPEGRAKAIGGSTGLGVAHMSNFARPVLPEGTGSTRCRFFHTKLLASSIEYMENQINEWVDSDESIVIKYIGHVIGDMSGKVTEPNLIVCVWY